MSLFTIGHAAQFNLQATYSVDSTWPSGYEMTVVLVNNTSSPTTSWTASFSLPANQTISGLWNGHYTQSGQLVTVTNPTWIGGNVIPAGGSTSFGMVIRNPNNGPNVLSGLVASANGMIPLPVPATPVLNPIVLTSSSSYKVSWNQVTNASTYLLQQDTSPAFSNPVTIVNGNVLSFSFTNQANGTYYYRVNASNSSGTSSFSNVQMVTINVPTMLSAPVLNPISNPSGLGNYSISWSSVAGAQNYILQSSTSSSFANYQTVATTSTTSYAVVNHPVGTYYYRVIATAGSVTSPPSNIVSTSVVVPPTITTHLDSYWESWNSQDSISTIVGMKCDVICVAFGTFTSLGNNTFSITGVESSQATLAQLVSLAHGAGKKVKLSIGGATYPLGGFLTSTAAAAGMAKAIASYLQANGMDGVDLDIEDYPAASLQIALIQNIRQLLPNANISYTPGTPCMTTLPFSDVIKGAHTYLSEISFMAYDYGPGYTYQQDVSAMLAAGVPSSKIVIGLMPGRDDGGRLTSLSDISTAAQYAVTNHLGGLMFWDLNRDHENQTGLGVDAATNTAWPILHGQ